MTSLLLTCSPYCLRAQHDLTYSFDRTTQEIPELLENWIQNDAFGIELISIDTSRSSIHHTYQVEIHGTPLLDAQVKIHSFFSGTRTVSSPDLTMVDVENIPEINRADYSNIIKSNTSAIDIYSSDIHYYIYENSLRSGVIVKGRDNDVDYRRIMNENGDLVREDILSSNVRDTVVLANIYNPDPITRAETEYGGAYSDNNDLTNDELWEAISQDSISLRWNEGSSSWELKSDFAWALDIDPLPTIAPPTFNSLSASSLFFDRSESEFEFVNIYYHINHYHDYLNSLGFSLVDYPLKFDAHAKNDSDQSSFSPGNNDPQLLFGDGGVDDGEDADVIVHEYTHAIIFDAAPSTNIGLQRNALDEGTCDYVAMSYSKAISEYDYEKIFNWDGHNEFWDGRELIRNRTYPSGLADNIYGDGLIWASALMEINNCIGRRATDSIVFEAIYSFFPFMTLSQAADAFLLAEENSTLGDYKEISEIVFCSYGLLEPCHDTLLTELPLSDPYLGNTYDFTYNNEAIYLYPNRNDIDFVEVFDLLGRLVIYEEWDKPEALFYKLYFNSLITGGYIVRITTDSETFSYKLLKFR